MKKLLIATTVALLVALLAINGQPTITSENTLVIATQAGYAPYESVDGNGKVVGFDIDIAQAIADLLGKKLRVTQSQFDSLIIGLKQGKHDLIIAGISITPDRLKEIAMVPYHGEEITDVALVFWKEIPETLNNLEKIAASDRPTITVMQGTWQELFLRQVPGIVVRPLEGNADLIMDLKYGKTSAVLFETHVAEVLKQQVPELQLVTVPLPQNHIVLGEGIGIRKEDTVFIQQVDAAVEQLNSDGTMAALEAKWFGGSES